MRRWLVERFFAFSPGFKAAPDFHSLGVLVILFKRFLR